jgi:transposase
MELKKRNKPQSERVMREAVNEVESGSTKQEVAAKYGIAYSTILSWLARFGGKSYLTMKRTMRSDQQKRIIVRKVQGGDMTFKEACLSYGIKHRNMLTAWIRKFDEGIGDIDSNEPPEPMSDVVFPDLKKALDQANLKVLALETMIDVAEEQFKIKIRKKPGAKQ